MFLDRVELTLLPLDASDSLVFIWTKDAIPRFRHNYTRILTYNSA